MSDLGIGVKPVPAAKYKHMMPEDRAIWERFLRDGRYLPHWVWYDVRVGSAVPVGDDLPGWMRDFSESASRKRIDVVGLIGLDYWVIEVKPRAGMLALGQAIFYSLAFMEEHRHEGQVIPAIVTDICDEDVRSVFDLVGVLVFEVGGADGG